MINHPTLLLNQERASSGRASLLMNFYREEFIKHRQCLERQREYYSEQAIAEVEAALTKIIAQLERLTGRENTNALVSRLLRQLDVVTGLSDWTDPKQVN